jgi:hypothetical protein
MVHMHSPLHVINMYLFHRNAIPSCSLIFSHLMSSIPQTPTHSLRTRICVASILLLSCFLKTQITSILQRPVLILLYVLSQQFSLSLLGRGIHTYTSWNSKQFHYMYEVLKISELALQSCAMMQWSLRRIKVQAHYLSASHVKSTSF